MYRISFNSTPDLRVNNSYGYGKSLIEIIASLRDTTVNGDKFIVENNSPRSQVQVYYGTHPYEDAHHRNQFKIHMSQHESTEVELHKVKAYNSAQEFWTANQWGADAAINSGVDESKVFVYSHGIYGEKYPPTLRGTRDKIRFLHIDSGSPRKRSDLVLKAFRQLRAKNSNIELTLKYSHGAPSKQNWSDEKTLKSAGEWSEQGVRIIRDNLSPEALISLVNFHDVLVYPSEGEGFGLIPLECMATGMPVISTHEWASYAHYLDVGKITSKIDFSTTDWGYPKKGKAVIPEFASIVDRMQHFIDNIEQLSGEFLSRREALVQEFSWDKVTFDFFSDFVGRVGEDRLKLK